MADENIIQLANQFRAELLSNERAAAVRLVQSYGQVYTRLTKSLAALNQQIKEARARGEIVNPSWLFRQQRYGDLIRQVEKEFSRFADVAEKTITKQQGRAVKAASTDSVALMNAAADQAGVEASFNKLPTAAFENLVGFLGDGSPLKSLLGQLPRDGRRIVEQGLLEAVALGLNPKVMARKIREGLGGNLTRALTIARTETLRAYRTATSQTYQANSDVVAGWFWRSARNSRCCGACIALDGTFHPVNEPMKSHPNCRCVQVPAVEGVEVDKGVDWFKRQNAKMQRDILATDIGYEKFKAGDLKLEDFVGLQRSAQWGDAYYQLSVRRALAGEGQFPGRGLVGRLGMLPTDQPSRLTLTPEPKPLPPPPPKAPTVREEPRQFRELKTDQERKVLAQQPEAKRQRKTLERQEAKAIREYTGIAYGDLNRALRTGDAESIQIKQKLIDALDAAIEKQTVLEDIVVFRGYGRQDLWESVRAGSLEIGTTIEDKGYMSTSVDRAVSAGFGHAHRVMLTIKVPKGSKGAFLDSLDALTSHPEEQELLLPRGSKVRVIGKRFKDGVAYLDVELLP